jgi:hypothetical protein
VVCDETSGIIWGVEFAVWLLKGVKNAFCPVGNRDVPGGKLDWSGTMIGPDGGGVGVGTTVET